MNDRNRWANMLRDLFNPDELRPNPPHHLLEPTRVERIRQDRSQAEWEQREHRKVPNRDTIIDEFNNLFDALNLPTGKVERTPNRIKVTGQTPENEVVNFSRQQYGNYNSTTTSTYQPTTPQERREVVKELRKQGFTQEQIANSVGVSQKTVSNDLRNNGK